MWPNVPDDYFETYIRIFYTCTVFCFCTTKRDSSIANKYLIALRELCESQASMCR